MLRLCLGKFNGRKLQLPPQSLTRPASQKVRHSIFNILNHRYGFDWAETTVLDVFAGSGAMGLEALSLGAKYVTFFEKEFVVFKIIKANIGNLCVEDYADVIRCDLLKPIKPSVTGVFDLCFIDPPYRIFDKVSHVLKGLQESIWVNKKTLFCCESKVGDKLDESVFEVIDTRNFGQTAVHFARLK